MVFGWMTPPTLGVGMDFNAEARIVLEDTVKPVLPAAPAVPVQMTVAEGRPSLVLERASGRAERLVVVNRRHGAVGRYWA
jgi:hypothetical protein